MNMKYTALALLALGHSSKAFAISENGTPDGFASQVIYAENHAGLTDTDGILSPGERKNPNIDYDNAQRQG